MFTGIIETVGTVISCTTNGSNLELWVESDITGDLKIDQSVSHNGICLTVVEITGNQYKVTAVAETIAKTNISTWSTDSNVNLERSLRIGDRLDGHFVQGHVDCVANCTGKKELDGSWLFTFEFPFEHHKLIIEKGSVCINGVSLTAFNVENNCFTVTIIPYTFNHTNFNSISEGTMVNIEFDVLGKYILRSIEAKVD